LDQNKPTPEPQKHGPYVHILKAMQSSSEDVSAATAEVSETTIPENERGEPAAKKLCLKRSYTSECQSDVGECSVTTTTTKLEKRLSTVLCCTVCLDLPISTIYQVFLYIFHNCAYDFSIKFETCIIFFTICKIDCVSVYRYWNN
jgi:hypothetical protein